MADNNIDFKELKKELKNVEKLTTEELDIKSWASDIQLWIDLEEVNNPKKIFIACVLTSKGEPRKIIQELENKNDDDSDSDSDDDSSDDSDSENEGDNEDGNKKYYPSLEEIVDALENFYGVKEDQNVLLRELRALKIRKHEKVKDFNKRYRTLYLKLNKKKKKQISTLDYADSLQNNEEAWKRVSLEDDISLEKAFNIAEKVDRLVKKVQNDNSTPTKPTISTKVSSFPNSSFKRKYDFTETRKQERNADDSIEDLTRKMKNLTIKACYFCREKGHYQNGCPKLSAIIEENKKNMKKNYLN